MSETNRAKQRRKSATSVKELEKLLKRAKADGQGAGPSSGLEFAVFNMVLELITKRQARDPLGMVWEVDEHGLIRSRPPGEILPITLEILLEGVEVARLKYCENCSWPFYAIRRNRKTCSRSCGSALRMQKSRARRRVADRRKAAADKRAQRKAAKELRQGSKRKNERTNRSKQK